MFWLINGNQAWNSDVSKVDVGAIAVETLQGLLVGVVVVSEVVVVVVGVPMIAEGQNNWLGW